MDPLSLIRKFSMDGSSVMNNNGQFIFGSVKYHEKTETSFKRSIGSSEYYYTVKDVLFFLENMDLSMQDYRKKVVSSRVTAIVEVDKQDLRDYLLGTTSTAKQIDAAKAASVVKEMQGASGSSGSMEADGGSTVMDVEAHSTKTATSATTSSSSNSSKSGAKTGGASSSSSSKSKGGEGRKSVSRMKRSREATSGEFDLSKDNLASDLKKIAAAKDGDVPVADRCTVLRATTIGQDPFKFALNLFNQHILKKMDDARKGKSTSDGADSAASTQKRKTSGKPIVIVPQSFTAMINSTNVEDFLVNSKYTSVEEKRAAGAPRVTTQYLSRPLKATGGIVAPSVGARGGKVIEHMDFKVVDNPAKALKEEDWEDVVAVFATGQTWQFKDWKKGYDTPVDLFSRVLGIHLVLEGAPVDSNIEKWNCKVLKVHQYERQKDTIVVTSFWSLFDNFLKVHRTEQAKYMGLL